ncbi:hypothetical protein KVR01_004333 [Diaporthe batatas]|uniref:uncharacterized protein n=1 Tax=Diaporthe batatas TaxID=748121 RepID=UPI001D03B141|nr:uncharacterized protein KVR01_004333 [Diaporthe batatas]KAG8165781.1 hypothetical protein KVR01_004333 [Diaporthe batatas]
MEQPSGTRGRTSWHERSSSKRRQSARESLQPWTPTRCHRLLRPLKTHISALRREVDLEDSERLSDGAAQDGTAEANRSGLQHTYSRRGRKARGRPSTSGVPKHSSACTPKKRQKRNVPQPGEIFLPTPVIRRARGQLLSSPVQQAPHAEAEGVVPGKKRFADFRGQRTPSVLAALESEMQPLRNRISATRYSLYDSILRAVHSILTATAAPSPDSPGGRSLVAMCLRVVPEYIGELEYWEERDAEQLGTKSTLQNSEVSNEIYGEVESMLPSSATAGHLRIVVRAHAIKVIKDSIAEGLLDDNFTILLIRLCCKTRSFREGEELLQELLGCSYPKPRGVDSTFVESRKLAPLKALRDFAKESGRPQFMQRQLCTLLKQQQLPLLWLSTKEFGTIWSGMVKALSRDDICDDTISLTVQMITSLSTQTKLEAASLRTHSRDLKNLSHQTLVSAITAVSTLSILGQEALESPACHISQTSTTSASRKVGFIIQRCIYELRRTRKSSWPATVLILAAFFTNTLPASHKDSIVSGVLGRIMSGQESMEGRQHYEAVTSLIGAIAQYCGRGSAQPSHYYVNKLCDQLEQELSTIGSPRTLRMDCAFILAERTNDLRDLAFAESLDAARTKEQVVPTPRRKPVSSSAYRWDEDICEWVTVTPAPARRHRRSLPSGLSPPPEQEPDSGGWQEEADDSEKHVQPKQRQKLARAAAITTTNPDSSDSITSQRLHSRRSSGKRSWESHQSVDLPGHDDDGVFEGLGAQGNSNDENGVFARQDGTKKRRTTALKPSRAILKTITNISRDGECSEDELGL